MSREWWIIVIQNYSIYIGALSATIGVGIFIFKKGIKPLLETIKTYNELCRKVNTIFEEMTPNGGLSVKDKVDRMDKGLSLVQQIQEAMAADTKAALFRTDSSGDCVWVNRTYTKTVGRNISEVLGHGWINGIAQDERDSVVTEWYKSVDENREFSMEFNFETPEGKQTKSKCRSYKMVDCRGEVIGYFGHCDILK